MIPMPWNLKLYAKNFTCHFPSMLYSITIIIHLYCHTLSLFSMFFKVYQPLLSFFYPAATMLTILSLLVGLLLLSPYQLAISIMLIQFLQWWVGWMCAMSRRAWQRSETIRKYGRFLKMQGGMSISTDCKGLTRWLKLNLHSIYRKGALESKG